MIKGRYYPILFLLLLLVFNSCKQPLAPQYLGLENLRVNNLGTGESAIAADLKFFNANKFAMKLKSGEMNVYMNNRFIGKTILDTLTQVPANDSFLIPVSMKVDMKQVFSNALDILLNHEVLIKLDGIAKLGKSGIYFNVPIQYEGKQAIEF